MMKFSLNEKVRVTGHGVGVVYNYNYRNKEYDVKIDGKMVYGIKESQMIAK